MPTKVLVFESDPAFAGELRTELGRLGLVAQVVDDGNAGLMAAASDRPDLILLSIELPRMNGFSVCNKLKKDPALKDVPLIIMSSESSDDTFEQHRKLRTRAEDYVHKPIAFGELLEHMRPYVELENGTGPISLTDDSAIIIDDEIDLNDMDDSNGSSESGSVAPPSGKVDAEVEAFANNAFDRLMDSDAPAARKSTAPEGKGLTSVFPPAPAVPVVVNVKKSSIPPRPTFDAEVERLRTELEKQKTEAARLERELANAKAEMHRMEETALQDPGSNDQVVRLQRELDELRTKAASGGKVGGVSSREFLDLREALNKKDKEILGLRDQIGRKEKDLLDASDTALALEREKADLDDRISSLEKDVQSAKSVADNAKADKDQAAKRAEDFKTRGEKTKIELESKLAELATIHKRYEGELAEKDAQQSAAKEQHQQEMEREAEAKKNALEAAEKAAEEKLTQSVNEARESEQRQRDETIAKLKAEVEAERSAAIAARETELTKDHDLRLAGLFRSNEEEQNRLKAELAKAVEDAQGARSKLAQREQELEQDKKNALETQRNELDASFEAEKAELAEKHKREQGETNARAADLAADLSTRTEEREVLARQVAQLNQKMGPLETELAAVKTELAATKAKLAEQSQKLETAISKWAANRTSFEQAKDAIAAAVAQIEEAEQRGVE
jgi:CheY-like chemotaxis protein